MMMIVLLANLVLLTTLVMQQYRTKCSPCVQWLSGRWRAIATGCSNIVAAAFVYSCAFTSPSGTARQIRRRAGGKSRSRPSSSLSPGRVVRLVWFFDASASSRSAGICWLGLLARLLPVAPQLGMVRAESLGVRSSVKALLYSDKPESLWKKPRYRPFSTSTVASVFAHGRGPGFFNLSHWTAGVTLQGAYNGGRIMESGKNVSVTVTLEAVVFRLLPTHPCYVGIDPRVCSLPLLPGLGIDKRGLEHGYCCRTVSAAAAMAQALKGSRYTTNSNVSPIPRTVLNWCSTKRRPPWWDAGSRLCKAVGEPKFQRRCGGGRWTTPTTLLQ